METKLAQANMILKETEEKHKLERELVRNAQQIAEHYQKNKQIKSDTLEIIPPPPPPASGAQIHKTLFNFLQMLKQVSQYKLQMKALREQESDMRSQVHSQGIMGTCINFPPLPTSPTTLSLLQKCTMFYVFLRSSTCTPRSLMKSRAPYQRVTASTAASNKTWTK